MDQPDPPPTYLLQACLAAIVCPPVGVGAVVLAWRVLKLLEAGHVESARLLSARVAIWCWVALGGAVVELLLYLYVWRVFWPG